MKNLNIVDALKQNDSLTHNGMVTNSTSLDYCLDFFFLGGASRRMPVCDIIRLWKDAFWENKTLACKILFYLRDCRGGQGEKRIFQVIMHHIYKNNRELYSQLIVHVEEYGYWKDIFKSASPDKDLLNYIHIQLQESDKAGLLAKFFPRKGEWFVAMHRYLGVKPKDLRKLIVEKSNTVEQKMCAGNWRQIQYEHVPSVAMKNYKRQFMVHDEVRYGKYIQRVLGGDTKINSSVLHPHEVLQDLSYETKHVVQAQWDALPDYMVDSDEIIMPLCDVSGSMEGLPMEVSVALGLYHIHGDNILERVTSLKRADWGMSTNLHGAFSTLLDRAVMVNVAQEDMPTKILIISDMEFNQGVRVSDSALDMIREQYDEAGYDMPQIIFWNVNGRVGNIPARCNVEGVGLVSGFSPSILTSILKGVVKTPTELMLETVNTSRYVDISLG